jgi:hypothetical protein
VSSLDQFRHDIHRELDNDLGTSLRPTQPAEPVLRFFSSVVLASDKGGRAFVEAQGLDVFFRVYLIGDRIETVGWTYDDFEPLRNCLDTVSQYAEPANHPILPLYPVKVTGPLESMIKSRMHDRRLVWRQLDIESARAKLEPCLNLV